MKIAFLSFLLIITLTACNVANNKTIVENSIITNQKENPNVQLVNNNSDAFKAYLSYFKNQSLPLTIKGCEFDVSGLKEFDGRNFKAFNEDQSYAYCRIPTNGKFIALLSFNLADCYLPILRTYDITGNLIDKKMIAIGLCGSDCGYKCEEFMAIDINSNIYVSDTINQYDCDDNSDEIPGTRKKYLIYRTGKLQPNGKIKLSGEIRQSLKAEE